MRRRVLVWAICVVGILGATVAVVLLTMSGDSAGDELPEPDGDTADRTLTFLRGDGAALLTMHRAAQDLVRGATTEQCDRVAETLDREAPLDDLVLLLASVADEPLQALLAEERDSLGVTLTACGTGGSAAPDDRVAPLDAITRRVQARLDALEAAR